jgi:hypothetical protein
MDFTAAFQERYEIVRTLGAGGMGEVFLARDRAFDRLVAVKTVRAAQFAGPDAQARFLAEARITSQLAHPNIIKVLDHGEDAGFLYIAFDYVEGGDLGRLLRSAGPLDRERFLAIGVPVLAAVAHAHERGVLHRDIKADNILLRQDGCPLVADFGLAKDAAGGGLRTATGVLMGTPRYMAPELGLGERATAASDQYALGVLLYEMLAGRAPFEAEQSMAVLRMHIDSPLPPLVRARHDVPQALEATVHRALEKNREARWPTVAAMLEAVRSVEAEPRSWAPRPDAAAPATIVATAGPAVTMASGELAVSAAHGVRAGRVTGRQPAARLRPPTARGHAVAPPAPVRRTRLAAAGVLLVLLLLLVAAVPARLRFGARGPDPRFARLSFDLVRRRDHSILRWREALVVPEMRVRVMGPPSRETTARTTTSVRLDGLGLEAVAMAVTLHDSAGPAAAIPTLRFPAVTLESVADRLRRARDVPGVPAAPPGMRAWSVEQRISWAFSDSVIKCLGRRPDKSERYSLQHKVLKRARAESGVDRALAWYRENGLDSALELAAALLDRGGDVRLAADIYASAHGIADLEAFCLGNAITVAPEALRFLFGLGPGGIPRLGRPVLEGSRDYSRDTWYTALLLDRQETEYAKNRLKRSLAGEVKHAWAMTFDAAAASRKRVESQDQIGEFLQAMNRSAALALEYSREGFTGTWSQIVEEPVPLRGLVAARAGAPRSADRAELLVEMTQATSRVHVDIRIGERVVLCHRVPPGYTDDADVFAKNLMIASRFPRQVLDDAAATVPLISVHCSQGDGRFRGNWSGNAHWIVYLGRIGLQVYDRRSASSGL